MSGEKVYKTAFGSSFDQKTVFDYLESVENGGRVVNRANEYLERRFGFDKRTAREAVKDWENSKG